MWHMQGHAFHPDRNRKSFSRSVAASLAGAIVEPMPLIEITSHQASWSEDYHRLAERIRRLAPPGSTLHHIGSTAVRGLAAKDIIDVQLTVDNLGHVDVDMFVESGFTPVPGLRDHAPAGLELAEEELHKLFFRYRQRAANLHVRERGRFNQRYPLLCRDFLRSHPEAAAAYEVVKRELASRFPDDLDAYYAIKDPVFDLLMAGANEWAERVSWTEPPGD
jgi:GrpB-like predicted nucleotidyltransferase (UPF0157 family)